MNRHIDVRSKGFSEQRTASTSRGVYRLTWSSYKRIVTMCKAVRKLQPYWNDKGEIIFSTEYTF